MCSRTETFQIKGDCCMLASKFHAGRGAITISPVTTRHAVSVQHCAAACPVFPQPVTTNLFVYLSIYLFIERAGLLRRHAVSLG